MEIVLVIMAAVALVGFVSAQDDGPVVKPNKADNLCFYNGKTYKLGASFSDGCKNCTCKLGGEIVCKPCPKSCKYKGLTYDHGKTIPNCCCKECKCNDGKTC
ncbi:protein kinase C-binding protein NELL2-like [Dreissena polymorpha]|uniref:Uncharacterized protein n=1 Tax=Dreissena polymorpha TaxID=45954 RepID=A0A9D3YVJ7_DREPO|nr:protein kinase C-binding protein NELL2-like [Dreissena polymorpha]KAH3705605.1 hypothetical protein DPMN_080682 [Dreissena polymorpha]